MSLTGYECLKEVLVIGSKKQSSIGQSLQYLEGQGYGFHFIVPDYPNTEAKLTKLSGDDIQFDARSFIDDTSEYVKRHKIEGVIAFCDMGMLLVAAICERCGLAGPTPEAAFLTLHKYYCRVAEKPKLWFEGIDVFDDTTWRSKMRYPCFVKPACMMYSIGGMKVTCEEEMKNALQFYRETLRPYFRLTRSIFSVVVDKAKFPFADVYSVIAEEMVEGNGCEQHCVEGWVDAEGFCHVTAIHDDSPTARPDLRVFDWEMAPSTLGRLESSMAKMETQNLVQSINLRSCFFVAELFIRHIDGSPRVDTVEVNSRIGINTHSLHMAASGASPLNVAVYLACGEYDKACAQSSQMVMGLEKTYAALASFWVTRAGMMTDLVDFDMIRCYEENRDEGVIGLNRKPGVIMEFNENDYVPAVESGMRLGHFIVVGTDPAKLKRKFHEVRSKLVKRVLQK